MWVVNLIATLGGVSVLEQIKEELLDMIFNNIRIVNPDQCRSTKIIQLPLKSC
ncbi:hypothetical protein RHMOL_Rhmol13G0126000 [Rhododendron molle]|uniref:Uncharacterized protein n=1 Tax=Rhododendron molle TaxID=49168 RepID=A0ACC0L6G9_RHOML|nr:hypothetical protein RHMOL_Rhmol13G0126000 [Rhododendron molle]